MDIERVHEIAREELEKVKDENFDIYISAGDNRACPTCLVRDPETDKGLFIQELVGKVHVKDMNEEKVRALMRRKSEKMMTRLYRALQALDEWEKENNIPRFETQR